jgi:hypothetical protein
MTQLDSYSSIVDTLLLDRERGIRLSKARTRAADALADSETNEADGGPPWSERRIATVPQMNPRGANLPHPEKYRLAFSESPAFFLTTGEHPNADDGTRRRIRIVPLGANASEETSIAPHPHLTTIHTAVCTNPSLCVTFELCYNDGCAASKRRTVNIQIIDASGCRVYWDRTTSGSWAGSWENRPDLGRELVDALKTAGLSPAGIHIGDDEAYTRRQIASIDSAASSLRRYGYRVRVKR